MVQSVLNLLDWLWFHLVVATANTLGDLLYRVTIAPLNNWGLPPFFQVILMGLLVAIISLTIKRLLKVHEKEALFLHRIRKKRRIEQYLPALKDWKLKKVLLEANDKDVDELYNTYIAYKFSWFGMVYLLPIFITLFWFDSLMEFSGPVFLLLFPENSFGIPGLSVPATFFIGYISGLLLFSRFFKPKRRLSKKSKKQNLPGQADNAVPEPKT